MEVIQGGVKIKAMRIWDPNPELEGHAYVVRLIREDEKRA